MAAITISCCTTTSTLFKGTSSPFFIRSLRHHIPTAAAAASKLFDNRRSRSSIIVPSIKNAPPPPLLSIKCYCTEARNINTLDTTKNEANDSDESSESSKIREAANILDIRVGRILKAWRHEEADSLYVEEVDIGEPEPRTICSGLVNFIPLHLLQDRNVIVLANLKARNMRGVKSYGMLMAASDVSHEKVELLVPPEGAVPGERVWFGSVDEKESLPDAASPNQIQKKKIWELVQPHLKTDESCVAALGTHPMRTSAGVIVCDSLKNANIS
ncbi:hypothetical protein ACJIZ3_009866 [Penstemon smallii]|uniref:tRNA-binding domain-containing protein n=1 Tax=Penstemon smallii TaxID=265156 RepID=A0ABD3TDQ4_9LAMI